MALLATLGFLRASRKPSHDRPWKPDYARLPRVTFGEDAARLENVRNTRYGAPGTPYETVWETRRYDLTSLKRLWFGVE